MAPYHFFPLNREILVLLKGVVAIPLPSYGFLVGDLRLPSEFPASCSGGSFLFLGKAVSRVGAQAIFLFQWLFKWKMGGLPGCLLETITKEKGLYDSFSLVSF